MAPLPLSGRRGKGVFNRILSSFSSFFKSKPEPTPVELEMQVLYPPFKYLTFAPEPPRPTETGKGKAPTLSDAEFPRSKEKGKGKAPMISDPEFPRSNEKGKGKAPKLSDLEFPRSKEKDKGKAPKLSDLEFPPSKDKGKGKAPMSYAPESPLSGGNGKGKAPISYAPESSLSGRKGKGKKAPISYAPESSLSGGKGKGKAPISYAPESSLSGGKGKGKAPISYAPESSLSGGKGKGKAPVLSGLKFPKPEKPEDVPKATVMFPKPEDVEIRKDTVMFPPESSPATTKSTSNNAGSSFRKYYDELNLNPWIDYRKRSLPVQQSPENAVTMTEMGASMPELGKCRLTMSQEISLLVFAWVAAMFICGAIVWVMGKIERKIHRLTERSATGFGEKKGWLRALHFVGYGSVVVVIIAMFLMLIAVMLSLKNILGEAISGA